jgi:AcrR family transcriptional regulator
MPARRYGFPRMSSPAPDAPAPAPADGAPGSAAPVDHRERLLAGMAAAVRAKGFQSTTLADVVREARVSRRTFYEHFRDPVDCYVALLEQVGLRAIDDIAAAVTAGGTPEERLNRAIGGYLDLVEADPRLMRSFMRELHLTGERGARLLSAVNERAGQTIHDLAEEARANEPELGIQAIPVPVARMVAAGIMQMALITQDEGRPLDEVRATAADLLQRVVGTPGG